MKTWFIPSKDIFLIIASMIFLGWSIPAGATWIGPDFEGRCVGVRSGDTIELDQWPRGFVLVRLAGVAAPQPGQPYSAEARSALASLAHGKKVAVVRKFIDREGVIHGLVYSTADPGTDLNSVLVRRGLAWADTRSRLVAGLDELQRQAQLRRRGLWVAEAPVAPWDWVTPAPEDQTGEPAPETPVPVRVAGSIERLDVSSPTWGDPTLLRNVLEARAIQDYYDRVQQFNEFVVPWLYYFPPWPYAPGPLSFWNPWWLDNYGMGYWDAGYDEYGPGFGVHNEFRVPYLYGF